MLKCILITIWLSKYKKSRDVERIFIYYDIKTLQKSILRRCFFMKKKMIAVITVVILAVSLISGCTPSKNDRYDSNGDGTVTDREFQDAVNDWMTRNGY